MLAAGLAEVFLWKTEERKWKKRKKGNQLVGWNFCWFEISSRLNCRGDYWACGDFTNAMACGGYWKMQWLTLAMACGGFAFRLMESLRNNRWFFGLAVACGGLR